MCCVSSLEIGIELECSVSEKSRDSSATFALCDEVPSREPAIARVFPTLNLDLPVLSPIDAVHGSADMMQYVSRNTLCHVYFPFSNARKEIEDSSS